MNAELGEDPTPTVIVVDDDPEARRLLEILIRSIGLPIRSYASANEFLASTDVETPGCLVLDVRMPGMSGTELQERLIEMGISRQIVILTGYAEVPLAVRAMRNGAISVLQKPYSQQELLDTIHRAICVDQQERARAHATLDAKQRLALLSDGERAVLDLLLQGKSNKEIAAAVHLSRRGIEARRASLMRKLQVDSLAELLRLVLAVQD